MLTVTDTAAAHLAELLDNADASDGAVVRFVPQGQSLALQLGNEQAGDQTFQHGDKVVLAVEPEIAAVLADKKLELQPTEQGDRLAISG
ncbi:hypothetical protein [Candidatus Laterigemmans baculatus]|uniref:hypothetical protein n=1 Tax=Candidatus Laterigemmans baculatus TaxID=2770505 RepID=UPI0013D9992B|nr:hypothetical protein [Candidatus Laterigemmans baculatus]